MAAPNRLGFEASRSWAAPDHDHVAEQQCWEHPLGVAPSHPSPARGNSKQLSLEGQRVQARVSKPWAAGFLLPPHSPSQSPCQFSSLTEPDTVRKNVSHWEPQSCRGGGSNKELNDVFGVFFVSTERSFPSNGLPDATGPSGPPGVNLPNKRAAFCFFLQGQSPALSLDEPSRS